MAFDIDGALKAGYSKQEIADHLGSENKFDVAGARSAGYSDDEIIGNFSAPVSKPTFTDKVAKAVGWKSGISAKDPEGVTEDTFSAGVPGSSVDPTERELPVREAVPDMSPTSLGQDIYSGVLKIAPTAIKGVADIGRMVTGDTIGTDLSRKMEADIKTIDSQYSSDRAKVQQRNFSADMADPNVSPGEMMMRNKGALSDQLLPTIGSMALPVGAGAVAGKIAATGKAIAGMDAAAIAARVASAQESAGIGAVAAQNSADTFAELLGKGASMQDAYTGAAITVPFSVIAGKLTGGGAETALTRALTGTGALKTGVKELVKGAAKEGAQETGEELGQIAGEAVGLGEAPSLNTVGKRLAIAGTLGAVMGGGVNAATQLPGAIAPRQPKTPEQILTDYISGADESLDPMGAAPVDQGGLLSEITQLESTGGIGNAPTLDAAGNQGQRDVGTGSTGDSQPLPGIGSGRGGDATTPISNTGEIAPLGVAGAVDGAVAPPLTYGQQPTTTVPIDQQFTALTIPPEVKQRVAKKTAAELKVMAKSNPDPVIQEAVKVEQQSRAQPVAVNAETKPKSTAQQSIVKRDLSGLAARDDLVGAIMRVTGNKGIAADMAQTITGDKAGSGNPKLRGLFLKGGTMDLGDVAELLRVQESFSVRDGDHLSELIRNAAAGDVATSMGRTESDSAAAEEAKRKDYYLKRAAELGLKGVGGRRKLEHVVAQVDAKEAEIAAKEKEIGELEAREERAAIQASVIAEEIYQEGAELTEADLMAWLGDRIEYSQDEINEANTRASERESRRTEANAYDDTEEQAQGSGTEGAGTSTPESRESGTAEEVDWLSQLFGQAPSPAETANNEAKLAQQAQDKSDRIDAAIAMLTGEIDANNATAAELAARKYKTNRKQIMLHGDGPSSQGSLSIGAINESRKRRAIEASLTASSSIKKAIELISDNPDSAFQQVRDMEDSVTKQFNEGFFGLSAKLDDRLDMAVGSLIESGSYSGAGSAGRKLRMAMRAYFADDVTINAEPAPNLELNGETNAEAAANAARKIDPNALTKEEINAQSAGFGLQQQDGAPKPGPVQDGLRFSRVSDAPKGEELVAIHNLSAENVLHAASIGGIPVPSIGITKSASPFTGFGEITLIASNDMIDPDRSVPVFDRDAYTARFPALNYKKVTAKKADDFYERMNVSRDLGDDGSSFMSQLWDAVKNDRIQSPDKLSRLFQTYTAPRMLYAKEVLGKEFKVPMRPIERRTFFGHEKSWRDFVKNNAELKRTDEDAYNKAASKAIRVAADEYLERQGKSELKSIYMEEIDRYAGNGVNWNYLDRAIKDATDFGKKRIDAPALVANVDKVVKQNDPAYLKWISAQMDGLFAEPTITLRGREVEATLDNIVDAMTIGATQGAEKTMTFGVGKTSAMLGKRFKSIDEIKSHRGQVVSSNRENEMKKDSEKLLEEYRMKAVEHFTHTDWRGKIDTFAGFDNSMEALAKAGKGALTDSNIRAALRSVGFKSVPQDVVELARQSITAIREAATDYFEAKPQRAVKLREFKGAVVPKGTDPEVIAALENSGLTIVQYNSKSEGDRAAKVEKLAKSLNRVNKNVLFSNSTKDSGKSTTTESRQSLVTTFGERTVSQLEKGVLEITQAQSEAVEQASEELSKVTGQDAAEIRNSILSSINGEMDTVDAKFSKDGKLQGFYVPALGKSFLIADNVSAKDMPAVALHELGIHLASDTKDTKAKAQMEKLHKRAQVMIKLGRGNPFFDNVRKRLEKAGETSAEEAAAYLAEETQKGKAPNSVKQWLKDLISTVKAWMYRKGIMSANLMNENDILAVAFANVRNAGKAAGQGSTKYSKSTLPSSIDVDGQQRPTTDSEGRAIHYTEEGIKNFWRWIDGTNEQRLGRQAKDSKDGAGHAGSAERNPFVAKHTFDGEGRPRVFFHGSASDFTSFDFDHPNRKDQGWLGRGAYVTSDTEIAEGYSRLKSGPVGENVMPLYVAIHNPIMADAKTKQMFRTRPKEVIDKWTDEMISRGWDSVIMPFSDGHVEVVVFNKTAIKSSSGNSGAFSATNPDIRYSRTPVSQPTPLPEETKARKAQRLHQDKLNRFTVIKEFLADQGVVLSEQADVYKAEERMHSRFANKVEDFREKLVEPLIKKIQKAGFTMEDVSLFLHAQHAKERNEQVARVNQDKPDGGSGMLTADAANVIAATPSELKALANEFRQITEMTKQTLLSSGVVAQDMVDAWESAYSNYVPLKGGPNEKASKAGTGKGLAVNAKMKRALGHGQREGGEWIAENILADYERAVMLAEKNRVGHHLIKMALEVGRDDLITIGKPEKRAILKDSVAYEVRYHGSVVNVFNTLEAAKAFKDGELRSSKTRSPNDFTITKSSDPSVIYSASPMLQDNEVNVYVNGHAVRLQINDELLARAYKNMGQEAMGTILTAGRMLNGYLSKIYTGYNPEFILTNIVRDFTTGLANITGEEGAMFAGKAMTNYARSFGTLLRYAHNGTETKWIKMYREDGGNTGAAYLSDMERLGKEIKTEYDAAKGFTQNLKDGNKVGMWNAAMRNLFNLTLHHVDKINQAGENAMRLAIYQTAIESGQTRAAAASLAKNSTVNFNRRGELGQQANALFLFFNAGVQGTASLAHAHVKGKHREQAWAVSSGIIALGYMIASALGDDDEYDKLSDYEKSRNMMIKSGDGWTKIPIPYGYGFFWNLGRTMADAVRKDDFGKMPWHVASSFVGEFTPFGGVVAGDKPDARQLNYALPTVFQIIGAPIVNRTGMGSPIFPESSYDPSKPDYLKMWRNTKGSIADELAQVLKPVAEVSPEVLKYYGRTFTGGAGAFVGSTFDAGKLTYEGADLEVKEMPFVRKFYKEVSVSDARGAYYSAKNEAKEAENELNRARKAGDFKTVAELRTNNQELLALDRYADSLQKRINAARDRQDAIKQSETLTVAEKRLMLKSMERDEEKLYDQFLERFKLRMEDRRKRLKPAA